MNEICASFKFLEIKQENGKNFSDYYPHLQCAVIECNYGELTDKMLCDKIKYKLQKWVMKSVV